MTTLNRLLRYRKRLLWMLLAVIVASGLWVLNLELTYERNVRHIPTNFLLRTHSKPYIWKA
jgi:hypothetical protein